MKVVSALKYYFSSIPTILTGFHNFWLIPLILFKFPLTLKLKNGLRLKVNSLMDVWIVKEVILDKQYECFEPIKPSWTIVDIGASIGDFSIMNEGKAKQIYAFEKDHQSFLLMEQNLKLNGCQKIKLFEKEVLSLKNLFDIHRIKQCDLLKIDCEGCEYQILLNAPPVVYNRIKRITMEYHCFDQRMKKQFSQLKKCLIQNGFQTKTRENPVHPSIGLLYAKKINQPKWPKLPDTPVCHLEVKSQTTRIESLL